MSIHVVIREPGDRAERLIDVITKATDGLSGRQGPDEQGESFVVFVVEADTWADARERVEGVLDEADPDWRSIMWLR